MSFRQLDAQFPLWKHLFEVPTLATLGVASARFEPSTPAIYLCGNSLGLMPKKTRQAINDELDAWGQRAVVSHFNHPRKDATPWLDIDLPLVPLVAPLVGARESEVAVMGSLTANLNALLFHFYKPTATRTKILFEKQAFPSDYYALVNLVKFHGLDESHLIQLEIQPGNTHLLTSDILAAIDEHADELALVCFPGIQYYTGQLFEMEKITAHAKAHHITVGWDLAHAVGNVPLHLHDWGVDFAAWCSYKYLNSGPGGIAGLYVHEQYTKDNTTTNFAPRLAGWWGNNAQNRFKMLEQFDPIQLALSYRQSNPSVIDVVAQRASLEIFASIGLDVLREKSVALTAYLEERLTSSRFYIKRGDTNRLGFHILTPLEKHQRGAQLSLLFTPHYDDDRNVMDKVNEYLHHHGVVCDERRPDVIRIAPLPLYNTFEDVYHATERLFEVLEQLDSEE